MKRKYYADIFGYEATIYYEVKNGNIVNPHLQSKEIDINQLIFSCISVDPDMTMLHFVEEMANIAAYAYENKIDQEDN